MRDNRRTVEQKGQMRKSTKGKRMEKRIKGGLGTICRKKGARNGSVYQHLDIGDK
jgi:hypothetical protein